MVEIFKLTLSLDLMKNVRFILIIFLLLGTFSCIDQSSCIDSKGNRNICKFNILSLQTNLDRSENSQNKTEVTQQEDSEDPQDPSQEDPDSEGPEGPEDEDSEDYEDEDSEDSEDPE